MIRVPQKSESPAATGLIADERIENTASVAPATLIGNGTDAQQKSFANLCAALALRGHEVHQLAGGEFIVCKWGMHRVCPDLQTLRAFARQVGAVS